MVAREWFLLGKFRRWEMGWNFIAFKVL